MKTTKNTHLTLPEELNSVARLLNLEGMWVVDLRQPGGQNALGGWTWDVLTDVEAMESINALDYQYPVALLLANLTTLKQRHQQDGEPDDDEERTLANQRMALIAFLEAQEEEVQTLFEQRRSVGQVEMYHLSRLFPVGTAVVLRKPGNGDEDVAGILRSLKVTSSFFGVYVDCTLDVFHGMTGTVQQGTYSDAIPGFSGLMAISDLAIQPLTDAERARLTERGRQFQKALRPGTYLAYQGPIVQPSYWSERTFRADGRVIIDPISFQRVASDVWSSATRQSRVNYDSNRTDRGEQTLAEDRLWQCMPYLYGFSMSAKQWGRIRVTGLSEVQWRDDAFKHLVMPEEEKELIHCLVKHHGHGFSDLIDGKGGGCIFLLHGEPGQGKTLVAESVAEVLHRPLYSVSVGELGTDPDLLENRLRSILEVVTIWDAVVLLDEADIFLEARDDHDVMRNAMVGVFLRLLEYHNGVMFLTTNRVQHLDKAFYSRISVALQFHSADEDKRRQIWASLLGKAALSVDWAQPLCLHDVNGRQIKNAIRLAMTLAHAQKRDVALTDVERAVQLALRFQDSMTRANARAQPMAPASEGT